MPIESQKFRPLDDSETLRAVQGILAELGIGEVNPETPHDQLTREIVTQFAGFTIDNTKHETLSKLLDILAVGTWKQIRGPKSEHRVNLSQIQIPDDFIDQLNEAWEEDRDHWGSAEINFAGETFRLVIQGEWSTGHFTISITQGLRTCACFRWETDYTGKASQAHRIIDDARFMHTGLWKQAFEMGTTILERMGWKNMHTMYAGRDVTLLSACRLPDYLPANETFLYYTLLNLLEGTDGDMDQNGEDALEHGPGHVEFWRTDAFLVPFNS